MTELMKLTEEDIEIIYDEDNDNDCRVRFTSLEGYEIIWTPKQAAQIKQQILENQKDLEEIKLLLRSQPLENDNTYRHYLTMRQFLDLIGETNSSKLNLREVIECR